MAEEAVRGIGCAKLLRHVVYGVRAENRGQEEEEGYEMIQRYYSHGEVYEN